MIHTVFTLSAPDDISNVRYIGTTTQTMKKRLSDICAMANNDESPGHYSLVAQWIRSLGKQGLKPIATVHNNTSDENEAISQRNAIFQVEVKKGQLLHSFWSADVKRNLPTQQLGHLRGRGVNPETMSSKFSKNQKQIELGLTDEVLFPRQSIQHRGNK